MVAGGTPRPDGSGLFVAVTLEQLASRVGLEPAEVTEALGRLAAAGLVETGALASQKQPGLVLPDPAALSEFVEFVSMARGASRPA